MFFQPIEFTQIEHETRFKRVLNGLFILITVYAGLFFFLAQIVDPGALFKRVDFLTGGSVGQEDSLSMAILTAIFIHFSWGVTAVAMFTSEICARVLRPAALIINPGCSPGFIVNSIPFFTLNFSIVLAIVVHVVTPLFFGFLLPSWQTFSLLITTILATNKEARAHVGSRVRQKIDTFTIGGEPNNAVHPVVSFALLPLRSLATGGAPTTTRPAEDNLVWIELH